MNKGNNRDAIFPLYAYSGPTDGTYRIDGETFSVGKDFRTRTRFAEYRRAGFNILLFQGNDPYCGEEWESSQTKLNLDNANSEGLKAIIFDKRLTDLCFKEKIIGDGQIFADFNELVAFMEDCVKDYRNHPAFYGLQLRDEPPCAFLTSIGYVYRAIKKVIPEAFVQVNLLPMNKSAIKSFPETKDGTVESRYTAYLERFLDETGADYILYDNYPFLNENGHKYIRPDHFAGLITAEKVVKQRNISFYFVAQTCSMNLNGKTKMRKPSEDDMFWQINVLLGFGISQIAYFTYWRKQVNSSCGEFFPDDGSTFISQNGTKNPVYDVMAKLHEKLQKFAPAYFRFSFEKCGTLVKSDCLKEYVPEIVAKMTAIRDISLLSGDGLFVSELKSEDGSFMYSFVNVNDPDESANETVKFGFSVNGDYEKENIFVIDDGKACFSEDNRYELNAGRGIFIILQQKEGKTDLC